MFKRYIGALIDALVILGLFFIVARSPLIAFLDSRANILFIVIFLYEPICTSKFCTLGQFAMDYRVRTLIGHERIGVFHAIWRFIVKALLGIISLMTIPARADRRGIHDIVSGTIVLNHRVVQDSNVITIVGTHAGMGIEEIFQKKMEDISEYGKAFWMYRSNQANCETVQKFGNSVSGTVRVLFIEGNAQPTQNDTAATHYSVDREDWLPLPEGMSVTGHIVGEAYALVLDKIELGYWGQEIDLWNYAVWGDPVKPVKFSNIAGTLCAIKCDTSDLPDKQISNRKKVIAIGYLSKESHYAVWLKS